MAATITRADFERALPKAIVLLREARGISQAEMARRLGVTAATMCRYEQGVNKPGVVRLAHVLEILEVDFTDLDTALKKVWASETLGTELSEDALDLESENTDEAVTGAYLAAVGRGEGDEFVERTVRQAQLLVRLRQQMKRKERAWEEREDAQTNEADDS